MDPVAGHLRLGPGARIAVIGGGPAGSFFALHLLRFARAASLPIEVTIFERKDFTRRGPAGCNKCAGILSLRLVRGLHELGLTIPPALVMAELEGYTLHLAGRAVEVQRPAGSPSILSVYRGGGPLHAAIEGPVSFDAWLLEAAREAGAEVVHGNVRRVCSAAQMEVTADESVERYQLVVLAAGVNARPPACDGLAYGSPPTATMAQDEIMLDPLLRPAEAGRTCVHVYMDGQPGLMFGAVIPKGDLFNISLLGRDLGPDAIGAFLQGPGRQWLVEAGGARICGCRPKIALAPARAPFADRFVAVGDAAATRLYKDGIGSAFVTARQAAWTAVHDGVSATAFAHGYAPLCSAIARDNRVGRLLFGLWQRGQARPLWGRAILAALEHEQSLPAGRRRGHKALWDLLTGNDSYTGIARSLIHPEGARTFLVALGRARARSTSSKPI